MMTRRYSKAPRYGGGFMIAKVMTAIAAFGIAYFLFLALFMAIVNTIMQCDALLWTQLEHCVTIPQMIGF